MIARRGGTVIFISSIAGRVPEPFLMPYSMSPSGEDRLVVTGRLAESWS